MLTPHLQKTFVLNDFAGKEKGCCGTPQQPVW
jgi:hypothetical protein